MLIRPPQRPLHAVHRALLSLPILLASSSAKATGEPADAALARAREDAAAGRWEKAAAGFREVALGHAESAAGPAAVPLYMNAVNEIAVRGTPPRPSALEDLERNLPALVRLYCHPDKIAAQPEPCLLLVKVRRDIANFHAPASVLRPGPKELESRAEADLAVWNDAGEALCRAKHPACFEMGEILYRAAESYRAAGKRAKAIGIRRTLIEPRFHLDKTDLAGKAMIANGADMESLALFEQAADWYERGARTALKSPEAPGALEAAVRFRLALGQEALALEDAELFHKAYGAKQPAASGRVALRVAAHAAEGGRLEEARKHLGKAIGQIDRSATLDVRILSHALLGRTAAALDDAKAAAGEYLIVRGAWKDPAAAMKTMEANGQDTHRLAEVLNAVGEAAFFFAEQKRAEADRMRMPAYAGPRTYKAILKHVQGQLQPWMKKKMPAIQAAEDAYLEVLKIEPVPPPKWIVASAARVGWLWAAFAADLRAVPAPTGPIPGGHGLTYEELRVAYEGAIDSLSEPLKWRAKQAFMSCLRHSTTYATVSEESRGCEQWLAKHYPLEFHAMDELHDAPSRPSSFFHARPVAPGDT